MLSLEDRKHVRILLIVVAGFLVGAGLLVYAIATDVAP